MELSRGAKWYAAYTRARAEKMVAREFEFDGIPHYLPLFTTLRQWSDRKKKVQLPLIRSYIFVYVPEKKFHTVLETEGVVNFVKFSGKAVAIPDWQINNLKILLGVMDPVPIEKMDFIQGEEVIISEGILKGLRGHISQIKGVKKLVISITALQYHLVVDVDVRFVVKVEDETKME
jgi:transcriptional antiterminator RfaH